MDNVKGKENIVKDHEVVKISFPDDKTDEQSRPRNLFEDESLSLNNETINYGGATYISPHDPKEIETLASYDSQDTSLRYEELVPQKTADDIEAFSIEDDRPIIKPKNMETNELVDLSVNNESLARTDTNVIYEYLRNRYGGRNIISTSENYKTEEVTDKELEKSHSDSLEYVISNNDSNSLLPDSEVYDILSRTKSISAEEFKGISYKREEYVIASSSDNEVAKQRLRSEEYDIDESTTGESWKPNYKLEEYDIALISSSENETGQLCVTEEVVDDDKYYEGLIEEIEMNHSSENEALKPSDHSQDYKVSLPSSVDFYFEVPEIATEEYGIEANVQISNENTQTEKEIVEPALSSEETEIESSSEYGIREVFYGSDIFDMKGHPESEVKYPQLKNQDIEMMEFENESLANPSSSEQNGKARDDELLGAVDIKQLFEITSENIDLEVLENEVPVEIRKNGELPQSVNDTNEKDANSIENELCIFSSSTDDEVKIRSITAEENRKTKMAELKLRERETFAKTETSDLKYEDTEVSLPDRSEDKEPESKRNITGDESQETGDTEENPSTENDAKYVKASTGKETEPLVDGKDEATGILNRIDDTGVNVTGTKSEEKGHATENSSNENDAKYIKASTGKETEPLVDGKDEATEILNRIDDTGVNVTGTKSEEKGHATENSSNENDAKYIKASTGKETEPLVDGKDEATEILNTITNTEGEAPKDSSEEDIPLKKYETQSESLLQRDDDSKEYDQLVPPDGGWGWMIVWGGFVTMAFGSLPYLGFGILFSPLMRKFDASSTKIAWIFNTETLFWNFCAIPVGPLCEQFGWRAMAFVGGVINFLSIFLSTFAPNLDFLFFSFSLLGGIGGCLGITISLIVISKYFEKHRGIALGMASLGVSLSSFVGPLLANYLIEEYGYFGASLIYSGIVLHQCIGALTFHPVERHMKPRTVKDIESNVWQIFLSHKPIESEALPGKTKLTEELDTQAGEALHTISPITVSHYTLSTINPRKNDRNSGDDDENTKQDGDVRVKRDHSERFGKRLLAIMVGSLSNLKNLKFARVIVIALGAACLVIGYLNFQMWMIFVVMDAGYSREIAAWCVSASAIANFFGSILTSALSEWKRFNVRIVFTVNILLSSIFVFAFSLMDEIKMLIFFGCLWGFTIGSALALYSLVMIYVMGINSFPAVFGVAAWTIGISSITLGPAIGAVRDATLSYSYALWMIAGMKLLAFSLWMLMPCAIKLDHHRG